jgi:hypothetical protein
MPLHITRLAPTLGAEIAGIAYDDSPHRVRAADAA